VTVTNVNEAPSITSSAAASVAENSTAGRTVTASDPDAGTTFTYSIVGGADAARFSINCEHRGAELRRRAELRGAAATRSGTTSTTCRCRCPTAR
jgi:hypothetical protein